MLDGVCWIQRQIASGDIALVVEVGDGSRADHD